MRTVRSDLPVLAGSVDAPAVTVGGAPPPAVPAIRDGDGRPVVLLVVSMTSVERKAFRRWLRSAGPAGSAPEVLYLTDDWGPGGNAALIQHHLDRDEDVHLVPVGIVWTSPGGRRRGVPWQDLLLLGDPRRPRLPAQAWLARREPERCRVVLGVGAPVSELRERFAAQVGTRSAAPDAFAAFVLRQATLAVERSVTRLLGPQYKIPRLVRDEVAASARFHDVMEKVATKLGRPAAEVLEEGRRDLDEMATGCSSTSRPSWDGASTGAGTTARSSTTDTRWRGSGRP